MVCGLIGGATLAIRQGRETPFVHGRAEAPNASSQAIELNPRCSGQAQDVLDKPLEDLVGDTRQRYWATAFRNRHNGIVVRASASQSVGLGFIF